MVKILNLQFVAIFGLAVASRFNPMGGVYRAQPDVGVQTFQRRDDDGSSLQASLVSMPGFIKKFNNWLKTVVL